MTSRSRAVDDTADGVLAFHAAHHDALKGTLAADAHRNPPRRLHSDAAVPNPAPFRLSRDGSAVPTVSVAAAVAPNSPYRTPQWVEFGECVRDVSTPPRTARADASSSDGEDTEFGHSKDGAGPGWDVVGRLTDLSQATSVDPAAVAAALREAERVLETSAGASRTPPRRPRGAPDRSEWTSGVASASRRLTSQGERAAVPPDVHRQGARVKPQSNQREAPGTSAHAGASASAMPASSAVWPWGRAAPQPPLQQYGGGSASAAPLLQGLPAMPASVDPTMRWYEVYCAWMAYYQQLYVAQLHQAEAAQSRHRRRARRKHKDLETTARKEAGDQSLEEPPRVSRSQHSAPMGAPAAHPWEPQLVDAERVPRHHRSRRQPFSAETESDAAGRARGPATPEERPHPDASQGGARADKKEAARLRAELRHLEEAYALLSSQLADADDARDALEDEDGTQPPPSARSRGRPTTRTAAPPRTKPVPPTLASSRGGGKRFGRAPQLSAPLPASSSSSQRGSFAPADTWAALSARQRQVSASPTARTRAAARGVSPRPFPHQRPLWH